MSEQRDQESKASTAGSLFPPPYLKATASELKDDDADETGADRAGTMNDPIRGLLEPPKAAEEEPAENNDVKKLDVSQEGGARLKFDALGPLVVNKDGVSTQQADRIPERGV